MVSSNTSDPVGAFTCSEDCGEEVFTAAVGGFRVRNLEFPVDPTDSPPSGEGEEADPEATESHK